MAKKEESLFSRYAAKYRLLPSPVQGCGEKTYPVGDMYSDAEMFFITGESEDSFIRDATKAGFRVEEGMMTYYVQLTRRIRRHPPLEEIDWTVDGQLVEAGDTMMYNSLGEWTEIGYMRAVKEFGQEAADHCPIFDSRTLIAGHGIGYRQYEGRVFNMYPRIDVKEVLGATPVIDGMIRHIFGDSEDEFRSGLEYLRCLWQNPMGNLPILTLVSEEQGTGKSSFGIELMARLFPKGSCGAYQQAQLEGKFNFWQTKLVASFEEVKTTTEVVNTLKAASTADTCSIEKKGKDPIDFNSFCHIILLTNNADRVVRIDDKDTRYWVRYVKPLRERINHINFWRKVNEEIPAFRWKLETMDEWNNPEWVDRGRTWFNPIKLRTDAWLANANNSESSVTMDLRSVLDHMLGYQYGTIYFTPSDLNLAYSETRTPLPSANTRRHELIKAGVKEVNARKKRWKEDKDPTIPRKMYKYTKTPLTEEEPMEDEIIQTEEIPF